MVRRLLAVALVLHFGVALVKLWPLVCHAAELARSDLGSRGELASNEHRSPLVSSGQVRYRRRLEDDARSGRTARSAVAYAWRFFWDRRGSLAASDRVIVDPPTTIPYYYGTFLWFPVAVEVGPRPGIVRDEASVAAALLELPVGENRDAQLAALGYTHRLVVDRRGLELVRLPSLPTNDGGR